MDAAKRTFEKVTKIQQVVKELDCDLLVAIYRETTTMESHRTEVQFQLDFSFSATSNEIVKTMKHVC